MRYKEIKTIFEREYKRCLKYKSDFLPENYNRMFRMW